MVRHGYRGTIVTSLSPIEAEVFLDLRSRLEIEAIRQSVSRLRPADLEALRADIERMERAAENDDSYALFEADLEFHMRLFRLANLPALVPILVRCSVYNHRNKIAHSRQVHSLMETARRHHEIVDALECGDPVDVERIMRHHVLRCFGEETGMGGRDGLDTMRRPMPVEDSDLTALASMSPEVAKGWFARISERWNHFDRDRFVIERLEIPPKPLSKGAAGPLPATRIVRADKAARPAGVILYFHGGGWAIGSSETDIGLMAKLADETGCAVIGLDFRLSAEAPHPAGLNDCVWGWHWLCSTLPDDLPRFVAGDFTGANYALAMLLDLRNAGEVAPDGAMLFCGVYSEDLATASFRDLSESGYRPTAEMMRWHFRSRAIGRRHDPRDPRVSPLHADLSGLPPVLVIAAALDPLRDDSYRLAERLAESESPVVFKLHDGAVHGFMRTAETLPQTKAAFRDVAVFAREIASKINTRAGDGVPSGGDHQS